MPTNWHEMFNRLSKADVQYAKGDPHGWIQWKGTDVCMDVHCKCGEHTHIDAEFCYYIRCPKCGTAYGVGANVKLIELTADEVEEVSDRIIEVGGQDAR